uniref:Synaptotagmin 6 n=1 Tax=Papio anubis TaxID=9555 RepID=A0A096N490_PAPAN
MPWRNKEASSPSSANPPLEALQSPSFRGNMADKLKDPSTLGFLEAAVKISHTSPDIPAEVQMSVKEHIMRHTRLQRQTTEPASSTRHTSFKRHLPRQMHVSSVDYGNELPPAAEQPTSIGRIKPELYKQKSVDGDDAKSEATKSCGKINFSLRYDYETETLIVRILKAFDLPAKDFCGSSDPYVKIYLLPDRKCKLQTRVHRKTLNPTFDENFHFPVPYEELADRKLHLSVFDFDRFSRHDMIGEVIMDNLFEASDLSRETSIWKDIQYATSESVDLGEIMFSLCYLPTAGRLTLTVIKCRNLKAMDITGYSGWRESKIPLRKEMSTSCPESPRATAPSSSTAQKWAGNGFQGSREQGHFPPSRCQMEMRLLRQWDPKLCSQIPMSKCPCFVMGGG